MSGIRAGERSQTYDSQDFDGVKYTRLSPLKYKFKNEMMQVPNRSYTMKEQDLAPIAPKND